jgi:NADPH:quinone reductase-like Zn-dependent oxidoreductase
VIQTNTRTMRAVRLDRYGTSAALAVRDVPVPEVGDEDVLVRVEAAALNPADWHVMTGLPYLLRPMLGLRRPRVGGIGSDLAGRVEAVGRNVTRLRTGDLVYGQVDLVPGTRLPDRGSAAELLRVSQSSLELRPASLTAAQAASLPLAGVTAWRGLCDSGKLQPGQRVLINGASGGVGTLAVQIAKACGAHVTGVCSARNVELVRSLGADVVVDYTTDDPTRGELRYDVVLDLVGNHPVRAMRRVVKPGGTYVASFDHPTRRWLGPFAYVVRIALFGRIGGRRIALLDPDRRPEDLQAISELVTQGRLRPVVDRTYPWTQVREAMDHLATRRARGKIVLTMSEG